MPLSTVCESMPDQQCEQRNRRIAALTAELTREMKTGDPKPDEATLLGFGSDIDEAVHQFGANSRSYVEFLQQHVDATQNRAEIVTLAQSALRLLQRHTTAGIQAPTRLGVCPAVVLRALSLLMREQTTFAEVEKIAECDPILATSLLSNANSALYHRAVPVTSVGAAIAYLGVDASRRVILAASSRPLFASVTLRDLWEHSVDIAAIAEQLAAAAGRVDPSEAFVAGLVHDLGCLILDSNEDESFVAIHRRLGRASCRPIFADVVLTGFDHGNIGARVLSAWNLPPEIVDAVRYHHRPEASASMMPAIVYLAESVSNSQETPLCNHRLEYAMKIAGVKDLTCVSSDMRRLSTALSMVG